MTGKNFTVFYILTFLLLILCQLSICSVETTATSSSVTRNFTVALTTKLIGKNRGIRDNSKGKRITKYSGNEKPKVGGKEGNSNICTALSNCNLMSFFHD